VKVNDPGLGRVRERRDLIRCVTGPGERNPDGIVHAIVEDDGPGAVTVLFEDLFGGGDLSFTDAVIR
jgi:hypothetical protein